MQPSFWQARWSRNEIGFHQKQINSYLQRYWPQLNAAPGERVLVPLCGKSLDVLWLRDQGLEVLGVELAQKAVEDFFQEQQLTPAISQQGAFACYQTAGIRILCGDFFALKKADLQGVSLFYDRAALIALPPELRARYVAHLSEITPRAVRGLLISLAYQQAQMDGPPFAVLPEEVAKLYTPRWQVQTLEHCDVLAEHGRFVERGLTHLQEWVFRLDAV